MGDHRRLLKFVETTAFAAKWRHLGLDDATLRALQAAILEDPEVGPVIVGTDGIRKVRFAEAGRGKSGGYRAFYAPFLAHGRVYMMAVIDKSEKENLKKNVLNAMADWMRETEAKLKKGGE